MWPRRLFYQSALHLQLWYFVDICEGRWEVFWIVKTKQGTYLGLNKSKVLTTYFYPSVQKVFMLEEVDL